MTRDELFEYIQRIDDPAKDYSKILGNLHYTHFYLMDKYKKVIQSYGLTTIQSNILGIIVHSYPKSLFLEEIKSMVLEPNSDVSRTVVRLAEKGFIEKIIDTNNRRKLSICATVKGVETSKKMEADPRFQKFTEGITLTEARVFIKFLKELRKE